MAREITDKQPAPWLRAGLDTEGKPVSQPIAEYRAAEGVAGEVTKAQLLINNVVVMELGPIRLPAPKVGKVTAVVLRMMYTDSAASLKAMVPEVVPVEERVR